MDPRHGTATPEELLAHASFLQRLTSELVLDAHAAADLAQDTLVVGLEHPPHRDGSLRGWIATVAANLSRNARRGSSRRREREVRVARAEAIEGSEVSLERLEVQRALFELLFALPDEQRTVLYLRYYEGLTPSAIAARLAVPLKTVKTRHTRAIAALRERLDARSGGDRRQWLEALAPLAIPVASGAALGPVFGGLVMKKLALVGVAVLLAAFAWWTIGRGEVTPVPAIENSHGVAELAQPATPRAEVAAVLAPTAQPAQRAALATNERATTGALDVRLSWSDGTPAAGIGLTVRAANDGAPRVETVRATTDVAGLARFAQLAAGDVVLMPDFRAGFRARVEAGTTSTVAHTLAPGIEIQGRVVGPAGEVVAGASIWCRSWAHESTDVRFALACAADGTFRLRDVTRDATFGARARGFRPSPDVRVRDVPVGANGARAIELTLAPGGGRVRGRVLDAEGVPLAKARVYAGPHLPRSIELPARIRAITPHPATAETNDDGTFEIFDDLEAGEQPVYATARGFPVWRGNVDVVAGGETSVEIRLEQPARIEGVLLDLDGRPMPGVEVIAAHEEDGGYYWHPFPPARRTSDEFGRFVLEWVAPGACELNAHDESRPEIGRAQAVVSCAPGATTTCELRLERGRRIAGRVEDTNGAPVAGWFVDADIEFGQWHPRTAKTAADGSFTILNLGEGAFDLAVRAPDRAGQRAQLDNVPVGTTGIVLVVADTRLATGSLRGRVVDAGGRSIADVGIAAWPMDENLGRTVAFDANTGVFELDLQPGGYRLKFTRGTRSIFTSEVIAVAAGELTELGDVELPLLGGIEVVFTGVLAKSIEEHSVLAERFDGPGSREKMELRDGAWRASELAPGKWVLRLWPGAGATQPFQEFALRGAEVEVRAGETTRVEVAIESAIQLELVFRKPAGNDFVVDVEARDANEKLLLRQRYTGHLPEDGIPNSIALPIGRAVIHVRTDDGFHGEVDIEVSEGLRGAPPTEIVLRPNR